MGLTIGSRNIQNYFPIFGSMGFFEYFCYTVGNYGNGQDMIFMFCFFCCYVDVPMGDPVGMGLGTKLNP